MAAVVTFDPVNLIIEEINTGLDTNETDFAEIYSEWKDWALADPGVRLGYPPPFSYSGADPISDVQNSGTQWFVGNGWKLKPANYDHQWLINGSVFTIPAGLRRTVPADGPNTTVEVTFFVSNLVDSSVARLDLAQLQEAVFINTITGDTAANGADGTPTNPYNNETDALASATSNNLRAYSLVTSTPLTLANSYSDWKFFGTVSKDNAFLDLNGQTFTRCAFEGLDITGDAGGSDLFADSCRFTNVTGILGTIKNSGLSSVFTAGSGGKLTLIKCFSDVPGSGKPVIDLADTLSDDLQIRGWHGGMDLRNVDVAGQKVSIDIDAGHVVIDSTCIAGLILVRGNGILEDNSGAGCDVQATDGLVNRANIIDAIWGAGQATNATAGTMGGSQLAAAAQGLENCIDDNFVLGNGISAPATQPVSLRRRVFTSATIGAATIDAADDADGEIQRFVGIATYTSGDDDATLTGMKWVRVL